MIKEALDALKRVGGKVLNSYEQGYKNVDKATNLRDSKMQAENGLNRKSQGQLLQDKTNPINEKTGEQGQAQTKPFRASPVMSVGRRIIK